MKNNTVVGLDIGSTNTTAVIVGPGGDARRPLVKVLGVGHARTGGVRREIVTDIEETTESVRKAIKEAELMAGVPAERIFAGIAGQHIEAKTSTGVVAIAGHEIVLSDIKRVHEVARAIALPPERELLHVLTQEYIVDNRSGIRDPIGMAGTRLEAEVYMVTASASAGQNLRKAVSNAGYRVEALVHESLATALSVLSEDDKEAGVALVNLGSGATEMAVFRDGKVRRVATIPWGGAAITSDLVKGLQIPLAEAERAKIEYGVAHSQLVDPREIIEVPGNAPGAVRAVARELIAHIIEQRLDEILGLVARELDDSGERLRLGNGIVITGGASVLDGTLEVAQNVFQTDMVRIGAPGEGLTGLLEVADKPRHATAVGLAVYGANRVLDLGTGSAGGFGGGAVSKIVTWLKEFF